MGEAEMTRESQPEGALPLIQLISGLVEKRCDRFLTSKYGLTMPQFQLLQAAKRSYDVTLGGLSDQLGCSRGNITGIVDRLERDAWLIRERSVEDRRVIWVKLTDKGQSIREIEQELAVELADLAAVWEPGQQETLVGMLRRMYHELKVEPEQALR